MTVAYTRISTDKQDQINQEHLIFQYCQKNKIQIDEFIKVEMSTRKSEEKRRIDELKEKLKNGDTLIVSELSRLGRKMIEVLNLVKWFGDQGVEVIFVNQPELSLVNGAMRDFMIAAYGYFAETEREFISMRTKAGLEAARAKGKKLGRPKGAKGKENLLDPYREQIIKLLDMGLSIKAIQNFLNGSEEEGKHIKYTTLKYYIDNHIKESIV
ncbi:recombinase family protein [Hydrogenimonas thermophila]|uniref:Site-specific DNA recombinase n=1 Tax=Hydrogenimonas thermophila TaxID=223786 RepID=A0A1I5UT09_9BACT|nr:recombinase family protein [Hydrogenimonas thermophila]SFP98332.1 Site-specific DNA recombinase [Hydrogenimonas thermophila]